MLFQVFLYHTLNYLFKCDGMTLNDKFLSLTDDN